MKRIKLSDYHDSMGTLLYLENKDLNGYNNYKKINYEKLLYHHKELLDKNKKYYIMCNKGVLSKKAGAILEFYGYDITQIIK